MSPVASRGWTAVTAEQGTPDIAVQKAQLVGWMWVILLVAALVMLVTHDRGDRS